MHLMIWRVIIKVCQPKSTVTHQCFLSGRWESHLNALFLTLGLLYLPDWQNMYLNIIRILCVLRSIQIQGNIHKNILKM